VVTDILEIVESYDPDDAQMQLVMRGTHLLHSVTVLSVSHLVFGCCAFGRCIVCEQSEGRLLLCSLQLW
jgi:histone acetyltransferase (RNA polymerase elongator complex component)